MLIINDCIIYCQMPGSQVLNLTPAKMADLVLVYIHIEPISGQHPFYIATRPGPEQHFKIEINQKQYLPKGVP